MEAEEKEIKEEKMHLMKLRLKISKLNKKKDIQGQEIQRVPNKMNANRLISRHRKAKRQKLENVKAAWENRLINREFSYKLISAETWQAKGSESAERENSAILGDTHPTRPQFKTEGKIKELLRQAKTELVNTSIKPKELLKGLFKGKKRLQEEACCSVAMKFPTCDSIDCITPALPVPHCLPGLD